MLTLHTACEKDRHVFYTARDYNIKLLVGGAHVADMTRVTSLLNTKFSMNDVLINSIGYLPSSGKI